MALGVTNCMSAKASTGYGERRRVYYFGGQLGIEAEKSVIKTRPASVTNGSEAARIMLKYQITH